MTKGLKREISLQMRKKDITKRREIIYQTRYWVHKNIGQL